MKAYLLAACALFPAVAVDAAEPSPYAGIPGIRFEYYEIEGATPQQIDASMRARSPMRRNGSEGLGRTTWQMDVTWRESTRGDTCRVSAPKTRMSITVLLPRLITRELTRDGLAYWRAVRRGLDVHEAGHARIAWDHREDFNRASLGASCKTIKKLARDSQARIAALQAAYDRETAHGRLQTPKWEYE